MIRALLLCLALAGPAAAQEFVVTFGGDVNFAQSRTAPRPGTVSKFGTFPLGHTTDFLATELTGDLVFVNVETVVSETDGVAQPKSFVFRSHPAQIDHLREIGVNAFSLANNHAYDHGWPGLAATLEHFERAAQGGGPILFAGIGRGEEALRPAIAEIGGVRVAMSAIGIGSASFAAADGVTGMAMWRVPGQYDAVLRHLAEAEAELKILSIHAGIENEIALDRGQAEAFRRAVDEAGVNLVIGHHPHVPRAVEAGPDHAIFYSLGNLLFVGGAIRDGLPVGHDYGLLGRAYFELGSAEGPRLTALEAVPLTGVHLAPQPMDAWRGAATIEHLNRLSRTSVGAAAAAFTPVPGAVPRGAMCLGGPYGPAARALCCRLEWSMSCDLPDLM
ncbi:CapA family protein [Wenxinia saemankumensis]|uniref:Poly-gamma-glutamate synthesis protein (Capsule biosynthesis protein) n=1 Tax=Wenxinia saemankumensis TaxID=1447782 RepID=A0A1M6A9L8_9RHOB|nr:CapA family protein [Wenxinia saemankumensis]SHI33139.1 poly-gamma-glutamate synthesis protein (capsule biosynthesis protein) [Wenxinia saemankumensis]